MYICWVAVWYSIGLIGWHHCGSAMMPSNLCLDYGCTLLNFVAISY